MTLPAPPIFSAPASPIAHVALVSMTVSAGAFVYTDVRCSARRSRQGVSFPCNAWLMALPGVLRVELRALKNTDDRKGKGIAAHCPKCNADFEVISHG